jgi:transcriptional regulator with XRE-family HTH domain
MPSAKLEHYLRAWRRDSGLSQTEVGYLLGADGAQVSLWERRRVPPLRTALTLEALYGAPVSEIFAGARHSAERELRRRARTLARKLLATERNPRVTARKLQWLVDHCIKTPAGGRRDS